MCDRGSGSDAAIVQPKLEDSSFVKGKRKGNGCVVAGTSGF